jgi:hypothetical protein
MYQLFPLTELIPVAVNPGNNCLPKVIEDTAKVNRLLGPQICFTKADGGP